MKPKNALNEMEKKTKTIKKIQTICNTIIANACYHTKEMESQIMVAEKRGNITEEEKTLICNAWNLRNKLAKELMMELKNYIENINKMEKDKNGERKIN